MKKYEFSKYVIGKNVEDIQEIVNAKVNNTSKEFKCKVISTSAIIVDNEPCLIVTYEIEKN
ncbi:MAG: hypothetical protein V4511_09285 [Bacteroidota bacterium]